MRNVQGKSAAGWCVVMVGFFFPTPAVFTGPQAFLGYLDVIDEVVLGKKQQLTFKVRSRILHVQDNN